MKETFRNIPSPLQKVILIRFGASGAALFMLICIMLLKGHWQFLIPCLAVSIVFSVSGLQLLADCSEKKYITIRGVCSEVERTGLRKRIKSICLKQGEVAIRLPHPDYFSRTLSSGDSIVVYVASNAPVYEVDGYQVICNTLAIERVP